MGKKNLYLIAGGVVAAIFLLPRRAFAGGAGVPSQYRDLVNWAARKHGIRPALLAAIVAAESGWNPRAYRAEPKLGDASRGLGQILLGTARSIGFKDNPDLLFNPSINLDWSARYLGILQGKYKNIKDTISAYNAGSPKKDSSGRYLNQAYVDKVMREY